MDTKALPLGTLALSILLIAQAVAADDPLTHLAGTWKVVGATVDANPINDPQITGAKLTFSGDSLLMEPGDGSQDERHRIKLDADSDPLSYHSERVQPADRPQNGWTIFEVKGDRLRMAFFDALRGRPKSFEPQPKLVVLELRKVPSDP